MKRISLVLASALCASCQIVDSDADRSELTGSIEQSLYSQKARVIFTTASCEDARKIDTDNAKEMDSVTTLIGVFAPIVSDTISGTFSNWLEERKTARTGAFIATGVTVQEDDEPYECMAIVNGRFGDLEESIRNNDNYSIGDITDDGLANYNLYSAPDFFLQFNLKQSSDGENPVNAWIASADYFHYGDTSAKAIGSGTKDVSITFSLTAAVPPEKSDKGETKATQSGSSDSQPGAEDKDKSVAAKNSDNEKTPNAKKKPEDENKEKVEPASVSDSAVLAMGKMKVGTFYRSAALFGDEIVLRLPNPKNGYGLSVIATVTETEEPSLALKLFADGVKTNEDELSKAISGWIKSQAGIEEDKKPQDSSQK